MSTVWTGTLKDTKLQRQKACFSLIFAGCPAIDHRKSIKLVTAAVQKFSSASPMVLKQLVQILAFTGFNMNCLLICHFCSRSFAWICASGLAVILRIYIMNCHKEMLDLSALHSCTLHQPNNKTVPVAWYLCAEWCTPASYSACKNICVSDVVIRCFCNWCFVEQPHNRKKQLKKQLSLIYKLIICYLWLKII